MTRRRLAWHQLAIVVRSAVHDRTWVGHYDSCAHRDTPAGPLGVVKVAVLQATTTVPAVDADDVPERTCWRKDPDGNAYTLWGGYPQGDTP